MPLKKRQQEAAPKNPVMELALRKALEKKNLKKKD
jgi:hypothetical protein